MGGGLCCNSCQSVPFTGQTYSGCNCCNGLKSKQLKLHVHCEQKENEVNKLHASHSTAVLRAYFKLKIPNTAQQMCHAVFL